MRIFISHSSRQKLFVKELKKHLPEHLNLWIDEKELLIGDDFMKTIQDTIEIDTDFLILIIDSFAVKSKWVKQEIEWANKKELELGRAFILPIVLEMEAWDTLDESIKKRKFIKCEDFTDVAIEGLVKNLMSELFAWLSKSLNIRNGKQRLSSFQMLENAENYSKRIADEIKLIAYPYRKKNPLEIETLKNALLKNELLTTFDVIDFNSLVVKLQNQGYLSGIVYDGECIYVKQERYAHKTNMHSLSKQKIARKAVSYIESGYTITLDSGSTTLEVAKQISAGIRMKLWDNLKIVTNFIPAAYELLNTASEMGLDDNNNILKVYIIGGRIRPNTLAIVRDIDLLNNNLITDFSVILNSFGKADIAFVGANGLFGNSGFAVHNEYEVKNKSEILFFSKRKMILVDVSKFKINEERVFATFEDNIEVITHLDVGCENVISNFQEMISETNTKLILA